MQKPTTIRTPEDLLKEINQFVKELKLDRSTYLSEVLKKGFSRDKEDRLLEKYLGRELSQVEVCGALKGFRAGVQGSGGRSCLPIVLCSFSPLISCNNPGTEAPFPSGERSPSSALFHKRRRLL